MHWQLAQLNIARLKAPLDDPLMRGFAEGIDAMNQLAEGSEGYVWRLQGEGGDATDQSPFDDPSILVNLSAWESIESLQNYAYKSEHRHFIKARRDWFDELDGLHQVLWWVPRGVVPSGMEAKARLALLQRAGAGTWAFSFKQRADKPHSASIGETDRQALCDLLSQAGLGVEGLLELDKHSVLLTKQGAELLGGVAIQACGADGLLRSLVVSADMRGAGLGRDLVHLAVERAREQKMNSLWLLTETAAGFFRQQGFVSADRGAAPAMVQASEQFRSLCPDHCDCLMLAL